MSIGLHSQSQDFSVGVFMSEFSAKVLLLQIIRQSSVHTILRAHPTCLLLPGSEIKQESSYSGALSPRRDLTVLPTLLSHRMSVSAFVTVGSPKGIRRSHLTAPGE